MPPRETAGRLPTPPDPDLPPSLAGVEVGDEAQIQRILLNLVQVMCRERGISIGDRLRVENRSEGDVLVRNERGRTARIPHPYAFFVHVSTGDGAEDPRV